MLATWLLVTVISCAIRENGISLPGKIICRRIYEKRYCIFQDSNVATRCFDPYHDGSVEYIARRWWNTKGGLLGEALHFLGTSRPDQRSDIVDFDSTGKPLKVLYAASEGEYAWVEFPSWDDTYLLFTTHHRGDPKKQPFEALMPMVTLRILDLRTGEVIQTLDSIGRPPSYKMCESPWLHDGHRFVYSISQGPRLIDQRGDVFARDSSSDGVYMYDMRLGRSVLLLPRAERPAVSAVGNQLAYVKEHVLHVRDVDSGADRSVFTFSDKQDVLRIHWTPDGRYIFVGSAENGEEPEERLIDVATGKDLSVNGVGMSRGSYSWK